MRTTLERLRERADWTKSAVLLLARIDGREMSPLDPRGDDPPQRDVPGG